MTRKARCLPAAFLLAGSACAAPAGAADPAVGPGAVARTYADIALATYGDSLDRARALQAAVDRLLAAPSAATQTAARARGAPRASPTSRARPTGSATRWSTTGRARSTPGRWTRA